MAFSNRPLSVKASGSPKAIDRQDEPKS